MNYFILGQVKARGCPIGALNCILYDKFYNPKEAEKITYGYYPWYGQPSTIRLQAGLVLVAKHPLFDFDIRCIYAETIYVVASEFLRLLMAFSAPIRESFPITVCSTSGGSISGRSYSIVTFDTLPFSNVASVDESSMSGRDNSIVKLVVKEEFKRHIFKFSDVDPFHDGIYCSETFMNEALSLSLKGVNFIPVASFNWRKANRCFEGQYIL